MDITVRSIFRYPVKGLSPQQLTGADLVPGQAIANDRRFALALGSTPIDGPVTEWMAKSKYLMLMRNEKLAQLSTEFDDETTALTVFRGGRQVARGVLTNQVGRAMIEDFFAAFMGEEALGRPKLVEAASGFSLSDHAKPVISLINAASVADLKRVVGTELDPQRFRGNLLVDGLEPWSEFDLCGKTIEIGDTKMEVFSRIERCAATNVNPETAERDQNIPRALKLGYGHIDCGIFAQVTKGGAIAAGDKIQII